MKSLMWFALLLTFSADASARGGSGEHGALAVVGTIFVIALVIAELWKRKWLNEFLQTHLSRFRVRRSML